jgi:hypothetical protein
MYPDMAELSRAVVIYLGFDTESFPHRDRARLDAEFGERKAEALEAAVTALTQEVAEIEVDWSRHSLESAGEMVMERLRNRYSGLSDAAVRALEWKFSFDWR